MSCELIRKIVKNKSGREREVDDVTANVVQ